MKDFPYSAPLSMLVQWINSTVYVGKESPIYIPRKHTVSTYAAQNRKAKKNKRKR